MTSPPNRLELEGPLQTDRNLQAIDFQKIGAGPAQARVYNNANISIATSGTRQFLTFNSERWDTGDFHSTVSNTGRLTAPTAGLYEIGTCVDFAANATGIRQVSFRVNGSTFIAFHGCPATATDTTTITLTTVYRLAAGDYVEVGALQRSGAALNVTASLNFSPEFWIVRLGAWA